MIRKAGQLLKQKERKIQKMNEKNENAAGKQPEQAEQQAIPVLTRFTREELDALQNETGANADATAVACFVRKNLRKRA